MKYLVLALLLSSCSVELKELYWSTAEQLCKTHQGVSTVFLNGFQNEITIYCTDGMKLKSNLSYFILRGKK